MAFVEFIFRFLDGPVKLGSYFTLCFILIFHFISEGVKWYKLEKRIKNIEENINHIEEYLIKSGK